MGAEGTQLEPTLAETLVGTTLRGTYRITEVLDQGGMGVVFVAEHERLRRKFAVKVLAKHLADDAHALARFHREAEIISQLNHPSIVQVVDFDATDNGEPYLVMELLHGESLEHRLEREHRLSLSDAVQIANQVASGLTAAHRAEIVHRDLKPGNVFLMKVFGDLCYVKLLDFGISKRTGAGRGLTGEFDILGTPDYMAPEQASGKTALVDHRGDQFALAVITYQMLTGALPFAGNDVMEILHRVLNDAPCPPSDINEALPKSLDAVILRALSKDPQDRYASIGEFARELIAQSGLSMPPSMSSLAPRTGSELEEPPTGIRSTAGAQEPTLQAQRKPTPAPVTGTHPKDRGRRMVSSVNSDAVVDLLDQAREALERGDHESAVVHAESALELAQSTDDALARRSVDASETLLARIFEQRIGGLSQTVEIDAAKTRAAKLSPEQAFLLSRLEGGVTFEEALDLSPMPRPQALRQLVQLVRAGLIAGR